MALWVVCPLAVGALSFLPGEAPTKANRTTSTGRHFIPMLMSCDRHSASRGQVTLCLQSHWFCICVIHGVMLRREGRLFTNTCSQTTLTKNTFTDLKITHPAVITRNCDWFETLQRHPSIGYHPTLASGNNRQLFSLMGTVIKFNRQVFIFCLPYCLLSQGRMMLQHSKKLSKI